MKKGLALALALVLLTAAVAGCGGRDDKTIVVGATPAPHAEILKVAAAELEKEGYTLQIEEFTEYVQPNLSLEDGNLDANYFQHMLYLTDFNEERGTHLVSAAEIHYEPMALFAGKTATLEELADGATIAVPADNTNEARALLLLQSGGLIQVDESKGLNITPLDITDNPKNLEFIELEAAQIPRSLADCDIAVINGNYAIESGLKVADALATESSDSLAATTYGNVVAVREGDEHREDIKA